MNYSLPPVGKKRMRGVSPFRLRPLGQPNLYSIYLHAPLYYPATRPCSKCCAKEEHREDDPTQGPFSGPVSSQDGGTKSKV